MEDAYNFLAHVGTSPRPRKAQMPADIPGRGLGDMGKCPIPRELWDCLVPSGLAAQLWGYLCC